MFPQDGWQPTEVWRRAVAAGLTAAWSHRCLGVLLPPGSTGACGGGWDGKEWGLVALILPGYRRHLARPGSFRLADVATSRQCRVCTVQDLVEW